MTATDTGHAAPYIFLSYASADREQALHIADLLEAHGFAVWIDRRSITGGTSWSAEIVRGIEECTVLAVLCSAAAMASLNVQQELQLAWEHRRPVLPLMLDKTSPPRSVEYVLAGRQWIDVQAQSDADWLPQAIRALANQGIDTRLEATSGSRSLGTRYTLLGAPARPEATPSPRHNLPAQVTSFVGRAKELAEVRRLVRSTRLLTLTGSGGCGKTRLALQVAADLVAEFSDGVWLVELAPLTDELLVPQAVLTVLGIRAVPGQPMVETLSNYLRDRQILLVLDNCEHLISASANLVAALLRTCPSLKVLATSRELLGSAGEIVWLVPSLALPKPSPHPRVDVLKDVEAVRLLVDRATAVQQDFAVSAQNAAAIVQICPRLDGIPLAIELAAARIRVLTVEQIAARLDDRFKLLTGGSRTGARRQQTLRAAVDWSYSLLNEPERTLLRRLAVFNGGWALEAAEGICGTDVIEEGDILDLLTSLVEKSLVQVDEHSEQARYRLLETIRQYAREKLLDTDESVTMRRRHRDWYVDLAERACPELTRGDQVRWYGRLDAEYDNLRTALEWSKNDEAGAEEELRQAGALGRYWYQRYHGNEGSVWLQHALERADRRPRRALALALNWAGRLAANGGDYARAKQVTDDSVAMSRAVGDLSLLSMGLRHFAIYEQALGQNAQADEHLESALTVARQAGDVREIAYNLAMLGTRAFECGDVRLGRRQLELALPLAAMSGDKGAMAYTLSGLSRVEAEQGNLDRALDLSQRSLTVADEVEHNHAATFLHASLAMVALRSRDVESARTHVESALKIAMDVGHREAIVAGLLAYATLQSHLGNFMAAARVYGVTNTEGVVLPMIGLFLSRRACEEGLALTRATLSKEEFEAAWAAGQAMTLEEAISHALDEGGT